MNMVRAVIVEDETDSRDLLKRYLREGEYEVEICGETDNIEDGISLIQSEKPNLVFLDIQLKDGSSFKLLERLDNRNFDIIFITAYDDYALKAFKYSTLEYILKPIDRDKLRAAMQWVQKEPKTEVNQQIQLLLDQFKNQKRQEKISIASADGIYFIRIKEIVRCEGADNYTLVHLLNKEKIVVSKTIKEFEEMLRGDGFFRVHKSHLINLNYMKKFVKGEGGYIIMEDGRTIEVSRRRKNGFLKILNNINV